MKFIIKQLGKICYFLSALLLSSLSYSQVVDFSGDWTPLFHEDAPDRLPGPAFGDFSGMPLSDEGRMRGDSYDPNRISVVTELQCRPHGADYSMRGLANLRITRGFDPSTQQVVSFNTRIAFRGMERTIWLDGREHPPEDALHTFQGFSTGVWNGDILEITTTHQKVSYLRRNGIPASAERVATEHWILNDNYLTVVTVIDDPVFLTEPWVHSQDWVFGEQRQGDATPCIYSEEVPINPDNLVPHYLPGENPYLREFAEIYHLPYLGTRGGAETLYPEFREIMGPLVGDAEFCNTEECDD
jgi:hypothetical protein